MRPTRSDRPSAATRRRRRLAVSAAVLLASSTLTALAPSASASGSGEGLVPIVPARFLETRTGPNDLTFDGRARATGRVPAGGTIAVQIAGRGDIPADATAAMLNVTAISPTAAGFLTVHPCGTARPWTANVNYTAGDIAPNAVLAKIGTNGQVCIYSLADTDITVDAGAYVPTGGAIAPIVPARFLETRTGPNDLTFDGRARATGRVPAGGTIAVQIAGRGDIPADATAAMLNVTAISPTAAGFLTVHPCGTARPWTANVNYTAGDIAPNAVLAKIGTNGQVCIYSLADTDITVDAGAYVPTGGAIAPIVPARFLETRTGPNDLTFDGRARATGRVPAGGTIAVQIAGRGDIPADATAAMLNVTAISPTAAGFLTVHPCGTARPWTANVNYTAGDIAPNAVLAKIGTNGQVCIYSLADTDITVDAGGYAGGNGRTPGPTPPGRHLPGRHLPGRRPPGPTPPGPTPPGDVPPWEVEPGIWLNPPAGRYVMEDARANCFWERFNLIGATWHQLTSGLQDVDGRTIVDLVGWEDFAFSPECGRPVALPAVGNPQSTIGPGSHVVGHHIRPGTYRLQITDDMLHCRWFRVSGFVGIEAPIDLGVYIEPELAEVRIAASDAGFITNCGTWRRIGG